MSVIVPVYNDAARLALCLEALRAQTLPRDEFEVIVVDNGSTDGIRDVLAAFPEVFGLYETQPGSYRARNLGLSRARGEVLAFTDADCLPAPDWLENGVRRLRGEPGCGFIGGAIDLFPADPSKPTAPELYEMLFAFQQERCVTWESYAATANMLTRRSTMDAAGDFDGSLKSGGDGEWGRRASARGFRGVYAPDAVVRHPVRRTYAELAQKARRLAGGRYTQLAQGWSPDLRQGTCSSRSCRHTGG